MPGESDDVPVPRRGAVRPPPSGAPASVDVPRMEPPPPSLEAMVGSSRREAKGAGGAWLLWLAVVLVAVGLTAYLTR